MTPPAHPVAAMFPMLSMQELHELADDIASHGLLHPIVLDHQGRVLDGRNRLEACKIAKVEPGFAKYTGDDPLGFVISENLMRRHLTASQRAMLSLDAEAMYAEQAEARRLANLKQGSERAPVPTREEGEGRARDQAAAAFGVSGRLVGQAKRISEYPELAKKVRAGDLELKPAEWELRRMIKRAEISSIKPVALESLGPFPILLADPPWRYDFIQDPSRAIENHYPTMALEEIMALDVPAAANCVLFLWVTSPKVAEALRVIEAWGFEYRTQMVWVKDKIGMGRYVRQQHESLWLARRGNVSMPLPEDRPSSVINAPRRAHSEKPEEVHKIIERMYPHLGRCELFARQPRAGWASWGNEVTAIPAAARAAP
jgi:N6-adenosine-specific RNA methylase IME4